MATEGCCSLRSGALAVGIVFVVLNVLNLVVTILFSSWVEIQWAGFNSYSSYDASSSGNGHVVVIRAILISLMVVLLKALIFNGLLVHGAKKSSSCAVLAWIIYHGVSFAIFTLTALGLMIACFAYVSFANGAGSPDMRSAYQMQAWGLGAAGGVCLLLTALFWYSWAVVMSFLQQLMKAKKAGFSRRRDEFLLQEGAEDAGALAAPADLPSYTQAATAGAASMRQAGNDGIKGWERF